MTRSLERLEFWSHDLREDNLLHHLHRTVMDLREATGHTVEYAAPGTGKRDRGYLLLTTCTFHLSCFLFFDSETSVLGLGSHGHGFLHGPMHGSVLRDWGHFRWRKAVSRYTHPDRQRERKALGRQHCIFYWIREPKVFPFSTQCDPSSATERRSILMSTTTRSPSASRS